MMFPSLGSSSLTTSVTRLHWWTVWRLRAAWWWELEHWPSWETSDLTRLRERRRVNK